MTGRYVITMIEDYGKAANAAKNCDADDYSQEIIDELSDKVIRASSLFVRDFELRLKVLADAYAKELVFETYEGQPFETLDEATNTVGEATSLHLLKRGPKLREEFEDTIGDFLGSNLDALIAEDELFDEEYAADCCGYCYLCDMYDCPRGGDLIARFESDGVDVRVVRVRRDSDA